MSKAGKRMQIEHTVQLFSYLFALSCTHDTDRNGTTYTLVDGELRSFYVSRPSNRPITPLAINSRLLLDARRWVRDQTL